MVFIGPQPRNLSSSIRHCYIKCSTDDGLDACLFCRLVKRYGGVQAIGIRQRYGGHFLLNRSRDNFFRRRHAAQERVVAMTMQMYEHGCPGLEREESMPAFWQACLFIRIR